MPHDGVCFSKNDMDVSFPALDVGEVIIHGAGGRPGNDEMVTGICWNSPQPVGEIHHHRHHETDFASPRAGEEGDERPVRDTTAGKESLPVFAEGGGGIDCVNQWIAFIDKADSFAGEVFFLERKDDEKFIHPGLEFLYAALAGGPDLRGDVIENLETALMGEFRHPEIETRIVYEDYSIRIPGDDILAAVSEPAGEFP